VTIPGLAGEVQFLPIIEDFENLSGPECAELKVLLLLGRQLFYHADQRPPRFRNGQLGTESCPEWGIVWGARVRAETDEHHWQADQNQTGKPTASDS
jgi:hypothetical protein